MISDYVLNFILIKTISLVYCLRIFYFRRLIMIQDNLWKHESFKENCSVWTIYMPFKFVNIFNSLMHTTAIKNRISCIIQNMSNYCICICTITHICCQHACVGLVSWFTPVPELGECAEFFTFSVVCNKFNCESPSL